MKSLELGNLCITSLTEIPAFSIPLEILFPDLDYKLLKDLEPIDPAIISDGLIHLTIRSWLLKQSGKIILLDTCVGAEKERPNHPAWHRRSGKEWLKALSKQGLNPEDVDIVMCTHLHADHVGWNTRLENGYWVPTFPNAQYLCGRVEYEHWEDLAKKFDKHGAFTDSVLPIVQREKMVFVEDGYEICDGLFAKIASGHTPGHLCLSSKAGAFFCGDVIHSPLQLSFPNISSAFCVDPKLASITRKKILSETAETNQFLIPAHFPEPGWTKILKTTSSFQQI